MEYLQGGLQNVLLKYPLLLVMIGTQCPSTPMMIDDGQGYGYCYKKLVSVVPMSSSSLVIVVGTCVGRRPCQCFLLLLLMFFVVVVACYSCLSSSSLVVIVVVSCHCYCKC